MLKCTHCLQSYWMELDENGFTSCTGCGRVLADRNSSLQIIFKWDDDGQVERHGMKPNDEKSARCRRSWRAKKRARSTMDHPRRSRKVGRVKDTAAAAAADAESRTGGQS